MKKALPKTLSFHQDIFLNLSFVILIINIFVLSYFAKYNSYFPFDIVVTKTIQSFNPEWFDIIMRAMSFIGNPVPGTLIVALFSLYLIKKKFEVESIYLLFSTSMAVAISYILKFIVGRPRPSSDIIVQAGRFLNPDSFPSGHVMFFIGFFGFILFLTYKGVILRNMRILVMVKMIVFLILIGISRIYLGAHWFSDVLGAYLVGFLLLWLVCAFYNLKSSNS